MVYASSTLLSYTLSFLPWTLRVTCTRGRGPAPSPPPRDTPGWLTCSWRMKKSSYFQPRFSGPVLSPNLARYDVKIFFPLALATCSSVCYTSPLIGASICQEGSYTYSLSPLYTKLATWLDSSVSSVSSQLEQKAQHFSELNGETISGLHISELLSAVVTESGKIYWW